MTKERPSQIQVEYEDAIYSLERTDSKWGAVFFIGLLILSLLAIVYTGQTQTVTCDIVNYIQND